MKIIVGLVYWVISHTKKKIISKITKSARGEPCLLRLDGCVSGGQNETTVFAHLNSGGMGQKALDIHGAYACHSCHDKIDGRVQTDYDKSWLNELHLRAVIRTQEILVKKGLM